MGDEFYRRATVDLDSDTLPQDERRATARPRRQCGHCCTSRSSILGKARNGCQTRALQASRRAHSEECDEYLQCEHDGAYSATVQAWEQHRGACRRSR